MLGRDTYGRYGSFRSQNNWRGWTSRGIRSGQRRQQAIAAAAANFGQGTLGAGSAAMHTHANHATAAQVTVPPVAVPRVAPTPAATTPKIPNAPLYRQLRRHPLHRQFKRQYRPR